MEPEAQETTRTPKRKILPSDLLLERGHTMRRFSSDIPTPDDLMRHATKFGTEMVVETAAELGYGLDACVRIMEHCDREDVARLKKDHPYARIPSLRPAEERCKLILGIEDDDDEQ